MNGCGRRARIRAAWSAASGSQQHVAREPEQQAGALGCRGAPGIQAQLAQPIGVGRAERCVGQAVEHRLDRPATGAGRLGASAPARQRRRAAAAQVPAARRRSARRSAVLAPGRREGLDQAAVGQAQLGPGRVDRKAGSQRVALAACAATAAASSCAAAASAPGRPAIPR